jgi:hypothetical protein
MGDEFKKEEVEEWWNYLTTLVGEITYGNVYTFSFMSA